MRPGYGKAFFVLPLIQFLCDPIGFFLQDGVDMGERGLRRGADAQALMIDC